MVVLLGLALAAQAAPVQCDPLAATSLLAEARISERRAPVTHPELIPGLALASSRSEPELRAALEEVCAEGGSLSLARAEAWEAPSWSAHTFLLTRSEEVNCTLYQRTLALSVGVSPDTAPRYRLRSRIPFTLTPVGDCPTEPTWREEVLLDGAESSVRLVLATDLVAGEIDASQVLVRSASPEGWTEVTLVEPAPERLLSGGAGPIYELTDAFEDRWIVAHADRTAAGEGCEARPGQVVWSREDGVWRESGDRQALLMLAERGLWRMAGEEAWLLILAQDDEDDAAILASRARRMSKRSPEPLSILPSAWFPGLNPGFLVVVPAPWPTEAEAEAARSGHRSWRGGYVKRAWTTGDPVPSPESPRMDRHLLQGLTLEATAHHGEALALLDEALRNTPEEPLVHLARARCLRRLDRPYEAREATWLALSLAAADAALLLEELGDVALDLGEDAVALRAYYRAIAASDRNQALRTKFADRVRLRFWRPPILTVIALVPTTLASLAVGGVLWSLQAPGWGLLVALTLPLLVVLGGIAGWLAATARLERDCPGALRTYASTVERRSQPPR